MKSNAALRSAAGFSGLMILGWVLAGQAAKPAKQGIPLPTDWSHRHLIFSRPGSAEQLARVSKDPRYQQQLHRQGQSLGLPANLADFEAVALSAGIRRKKHKTSNGFWAEDLGSGASVGAGNYPAKFSVNSTTANCGGGPAQPDFVVYSTGVAGSSGQASIVAFDNLYSGCGGGTPPVPVPSVYWAYNTLGTVLTSPLISLDGTQVAFVETNGSSAFLVVLKWATSDGTVFSPRTLTVTPAGTYSVCTAPCMTELPLGADDTTSSVFYDYANDIGWVGDASGLLHKMIGVFKGSPTEITTGGFPVQVSTNALSSPVYDGLSQNVFVGDLPGDVGGFLYRVSATTAGVTQSGQLDFGVGIVEGPIVDSSDGFVYVFASSDGTGNCSGGTSACSAVYQLTPAFSSGDVGTETTAGTSVALGGTPNPMYLGAFDSAYFTSVGPTGNLYVCGNTAQNPIVYQIPITAGGLPAQGVPLVTLVSAGPNPACSPVTDVLNPSLAVGAEERLYVSVQNNGVPTNCGGGGCVLNFIDSSWKASTSYQVGQEILDSHFNIETVTTAGTSSGSGAPGWATLAGGATTDGSVHWINQSVLVAAPLLVWIHNHPYKAGNRILDSHGNIQVVTLPATGTGTSGASAPSWNTIPGKTTTDGTVTWTNAGSIPTAALASSGGSSGIIIDNTVGGGGNSQVYFSTLGNQNCATSGGSGGCAVQAAQPGLN